MASQTAKGVAGVRDAAAVVAEGGVGVVGAGADAGVDAWAVAAATTAHEMQEPALVDPTWTDEEGTAMEATAPETD